MEKEHRPKDRITINEDGPAEKVWSVVAMTMEGKAKDMLWADTDLGQGQVAREVFGLLTGMEPAPVGYR